MEYGSEVLVQDQELDQNGRDWRGGTSVGYTAFADCKSLTSIIIQESVTKIMGEAFRGAYEYIMVYNLSSLNLQSGKCGLSIHATVKTSLSSSEAYASDARLSALMSASSYVSTSDTIVVSLIDGDRCMAMIEQTVGKAYVLIIPEETGLVFEG